MSETNWAGNYVYRATRLHTPSCVEQVQEIVARAGRIHVLGSRHSFTGMADSSELISLRELPRNVVIDRAAGVVSCGAGLTHGELATRLGEDGVGLANLGSLAHISVGGAIATATHGSGDVNGNLATSVVGLEMVTSSGELLRSSRGDADFDGLVVGLGALGAVTRVSLEVRPAYLVRQRVFEGLDWSALFDHFDEIMSSGYSVSLFTRWGEMIDQAWVKYLMDDASEPGNRTFFGAVAADANRHPIPGFDPVNCTPQLGVPGPWFERLPHFRMGYMPSSGDELQSEYLVPRRNAIAAMEAVRGLAGDIQPLLQVSEIRTVAADRLWMSPQSGQDTIGLHFTWKPDQAAVEQVLVLLEEVLAPFEARPHWGKLFAMISGTLDYLYARLPDFRRLVARLDPRGAFRNSWLTTHVLGPE
jgi:alditol oxidase